MKKRFLVEVIVGIFLICTNGMANATYFSDTVEFGTTSDFIQISDYYSYTHNISLTDFDPDLSTWDNLILNDATLTLRHFGNNNVHTGANNNNQHEVWFSYADDRTEKGIFIGQLSESISGWFTDSWTLSDEVLSLITIGTPWSLTINLSETTNNIDTLKIDFSTLSGNAYYNQLSSTGGAIPNPEPSTMLLLGFGLIGLAGIARKTICLNEKQ